MCTLSAVVVRRGLRIAMNRDEQRSRPAALPPVVLTFSSHKAIFPIDPQSGGTWIAVSDAGFALALLNRSHPVETGLSYGSRGTIIPGLLHARTRDEALREARALDLHAYPPFSLVLFDRNDAVTLSSDGRAFEQSEHPFLKVGPAVWSSSGLGDERVVAPRAELFARTVMVDPTPGAQDAFHAHRWEGRSELSVMMSRDDARTVSRTVIDLGDDGVKMSYRADVPAGEIVETWLQVVKF